MRVLMVTPEASPFAQTGGLGEVMSALPAALVKLGFEIDVLMPKYRGISPDCFDIRKTGLEVDLTLNAKRVHSVVWEHNDPRGVRYLFLECDEYYDREYLYCTPEADYPDNAERFVYLTRAAIEMAIADKRPYDLYHAHDWHAALTPVYLRTLYAGEPMVERSASVITIHNLGYQGIFWHLDMPLVGVGWEFFTPKHMEFHGKVNFLKSGIIFCDEVNTVSPGYRNEILTPEFGFGLEGVLSEKGSRLTGILNGVDYSVWNPVADSFIASSYSPGDLAGKSACKADLQRISDLPLRPEVPVISMVCRLSGQKGIDLLERAVHDLMSRDMQLVLLGTGESRFQRSFKELADQYPDKTGLFLRHDCELAHKIFAGSDMLMVPSRYEPCGINQLYALKYGTVPIVRATGGLTDTVEEFAAGTDSGTGFRFSEPSHTALAEAIFKAVDLYAADPDAWRRLMVRGMNRDFSWSRSAEEYARMYERAIRTRAEYLEDMNRQT